MQIKLVKSISHRPPRQVATCNSLGLYGIGDVVKVDGEQLPKIIHIKHLIEILEETK